MKRLTTIAIEWTDALGEKVFEPDFNHPTWKVVELLNRKLLDADRLDLRDFAVILEEFQEARRIWLEATQKSFADELKNL